MPGYRALLRLYPASFRNEYGEEMCRLFARRLRDARGASTLLVWVEAVADVLVNASRAHGDVLGQDLRYTARTLGRSPGFTLTAIVVAALGIAATTAAFSIVDHVLLRPLPYQEPDRLVRLYRDQSQRGYPRMELSPPNYRDWHRMTTSFESMGAFWPTAATVLIAPGAPERLEGAQATFEALPMLGVAPALGRFFTEREDREGAPGTIVLSDALWRGAFGGDPGIVGHKIVLDDEPHLVVGVMPRGFLFPNRAAQFWIPMRFRHDQDYVDRTNYYLYGIARLRGGVTIDEARAELRLVAAQRERQYPKENQATSAVVIDLRSDLSRQARLLLLALFGASVCVLLIACTNLANLLLARALARRREMAVRTALGAGRERLARQMITESIVLAVAGGVLGVVAGLAATPLAGRLVPNALPIAELPDANLRMLLFAAAVTIGTGLASGVLPALRGGRVDAAALAEGARSGSGRRTERLRAILVVAEVTGSVVL